MHDPGVRAEVRSQFGEGAFTAQGDLDRHKIRGIVFSNRDKRQALEKILHPRIRECWEPLATRTANTPEWLVADIPLLYETGAEPYFKAVVVVACSPSVQLARLASARNLDLKMAARIIAAQLDLNMKVQKASQVVWNDASQECLDEQAALAAAYFQKYNG